MRCFICGNTSFHIRPPKPKNRAIGNRSLHGNNGNVLMRVPLHECPFCGYVARDNLEEFAHPHVSAFLKKEEFSENELGITTKIVRKYYRRYLITKFSTNHKSLGGYITAKQSLYAAEQVFEPEMVLTKLRNLALNEVIMVMKYENRCSNIELLLETADLFRQQGEFHLAEKAAYAGIKMIEEKQESLLRKILEFEIVLIQRKQNGIYFIRDMYKDKKNK